MTDPLPRQSKLAEVSLSCGLCGGTGRDGRQACWQCEGDGTVIGLVGLADLARIITAVERANDEKVVP